VDYVRNLFIIVIKLYKNKLARRFCIFTGRRVIIEMLENIFVKINNFFKKKQEKKLKISLLSNFA